MNYLYSLIFVCAILTGLQCSIVKDINLWESSLYADDDENNCKQEGLMCKNCSIAALCMSNGTGGFNQYETEICDSTQTCLNGACTTVSNPGCVKPINVPFPCTSKGVFPDPFDCKKYHICCGNPTSDGVTCEGNYGFEPATTYCKIPLINNTCSEVPVPKCVKAGQLGALLRNKSIYYICQMKTTVENEIVPYPVQYLCANGKSFVNNHCT